MVSNMRMYCIYRITNKINGKTYVGQHKYSDDSNPMKGYKGSGVLLKKAYKKYGLENFKIEVLYKRIRDKSTVNAMEIWAIEKYKPEYNIAKGGDGAYGTKHSDEAKKRISEYQKGKHTSEETKRKLSEAHKGKTFSEEHKANLSASHKGKNLPEEQRRKMSESHKGKKLGPFTEEHKRKLSEARKAYWAAKRGE